MTMSPEQLIAEWYAQVECLREFSSDQPMIPGWSVHHTEALVKLKQAGRAPAKFRAYEVALAARGLTHSDEVEDLQFYGETFYYFAWRFVRLLRLVNARRADGLTYRPFKNFAPEGVRRVRNHLIEHTDKAGGVAVQAFSFFVPEGIVLQLMAVDKRGLLDRGLYPNAEEMLVDLRERILRAANEGTVPNQ